MRGKIEGKTPCVQEGDELKRNDRIRTACCDLLATIDEMKYKINLILDMAEVAEVGMENSLARRKLYGTFSALEKAENYVSEFKEFF